MDRIRPAFSRSFLLWILFTLCLSLGLLAVGGCSEQSALLDPAERAGVSDGKAHTDTFTLLAYDLDSVHLAGSFNGWVDNDPAWELTLQPDGYSWRLIAQVPDGMITYKFVLRIGAQMEWLTDPAAVEVTPDGFHSSPAYWNSQRGRQIVTPDPLPAPIDRTRLVIYEVNLNDFSATGTFAGATANLTALADLADLGVNAIELMPVTAPSYNGWGYDPVLQYAPNPFFGWPTTFAGLVDAAHDLGMAVILDSVINHMSGSAPLRQLDDFTGTNHFTTTEANPWGLVELNWTDPALKEHILGSLCHWVDTYKVDGFRFDYIGGEPYSTWVWVKDQLRAKYPDLLLIAEDFNYPANSITYGFDAQWGGNHTDGWGGGGNNFNQVMITALTQNGFAWRGELVPSVGAWGIAYNNMWAVANVISGNSNYAGAAPGDGFSDVKFLESHDENRVAWSVDNIGSVDAQTIGGIRKAHLGAVVSLTSVGIPMIYNGQEIGSDEYRPQGTSTYKINWNGGDAGVRRAYKALINFRLNHPALNTENIFFHWRPGNIDQVEYTMVYWRGSTNVDNQAEVVVACNFDHLDHTLDVPFPATGIWVKYDALAGNMETVSVPGPTRTMIIPASSALMWFKEDGVTGVP
ncbi:MAG: alpha-amylase family glycosyl hydrolase [Candidatus Krumholzibacteriota bacterium]